jgi:transcription termination factor NusB
MNVSYRINARKVVLSYFYQCCFFVSLEHNPHAAQEVLSLEQVYPTHEDYDHYKKAFVQQIQNYEEQDEPMELDYILQNFYDKRTQSIDMDYVLQVGTQFHVYHPIVQEHVNKYTTSFQFSKMDIIDQALFTLGYAERKILNTPKEILLNELVELSKRYADTGSAKLVNGIMHQIVSENQ